jgi:hypothetical protein
MVRLSPYSSPAATWANQEKTPPPLEPTGGPHEVADHGGQRAGEGSCSPQTLPSVGTDCGLRSLPWRGDSMLMVNSCIKVRLDLQADKSSVVAKGPFFPRVVNPRYRIRGTNV